MQLGSGAKKKVNKSRLTGNKQIWVMFQKLKIFIYQFVINFHSHDG